MMKIALYDIDGTIINGQTQILLAKYLYKNKKLGYRYLMRILSWYFLYKIGFIKDLSKIMEKSYLLIENWGVNETNLLLDDFFNKVIVKNIFKDVVIIINEQKKEGFKIILLSSTIQPIVNRIKKYLKIDNGFGTLLEIKNNKYSGKIQGNVLYGKNKKFFILDYIADNNINFNDSIAISDHYSDIELLQLFGEVIVVKPNLIMNKIAINNNWKIIRPLI